MVATVMMATPTALMAMVSTLPLVMVMVRALSHDDGVFANESNAAFKADCVVKTSGPICARLLWYCAES